MMWKTLVQGHVDYCTYICPANCLNSSKLKIYKYGIQEKYQKSETLTMAEVKNFETVFTAKKTGEVYRVIYTWKILEELVPNCGIKFTSNER
jgi:hypothetical protein